MSDDLTTQPERAPRFEFRTVAEVNLGTGRNWKAKVTFDIERGFKPLDVTLFDCDRGESVTLPIELWGLFASRVAEELAL